MALLTKSNYLIGLQCPKYLWTVTNRKQEMPEFDEATQHRFKQGHILEGYAHKWFSNALNIPTDNFMGNIRKTQTVLKLNKPLFEPGFMVENLYSRADVLEPVGDGWNIVEIKSATKVKEINLHDLSFQKYVYEKSGLKINRCYLMHINNEYVRQGDIEPKKLLIKEDITKDVEIYSKGIEDRIKEMLAIMQQVNNPEIKIGKHCSDPYSCPLKDKCWDFVPDKNVFELYRAGIKSFELFERGILNLEEIPDDYKLTQKQDIQKQCAQTGNTYIDKKQLSTFLSQLKYPLHFLDFETYNSAIPFSDGLRPYQRIPFQFSLHIKESPTSKVEHLSFLAQGTNDPRLTFLVSLNNLIKDKGSIVVFNQAFEKGVLGELAQTYPSYNTWVNSLLPRFVDLLVPFKNFWYYDPKQEGRASLKHVLPALTGQSYDQMKINNGNAASLAFLNITHGEAAEEEIKQVRQDLEEYCGLDTEGMIWILEKLKEVVK